MSLKIITLLFRGDVSYYEKFADGHIVNIQDILPFDIPDSWEWTRLSSLCIKEIKRGKAPKYSKKSSTLVFAQKCNLKKGGINYGLSQYLDEDVLSKYDDAEFLHKGDIVINSTGTGTLGRVGYIDIESDLPIVPDSHVTTIRVSNVVNPTYIYFLLKSLQPMLEKSGEGSTNQKELKPNTIQDLFVPLPPYAEQIKLCHMIEKYFNYLKEIEANIS